MHIDVHPLNYGAPPPPRNADPRRMFMYLLPAAICVGAIIGSLMIEYTFPNGDSRNLSGPMCVPVTAPLVLFLETKDPDGVLPVLIEVLTSERVMGNDLSTVPIAVEDGEQFRVVHPPYFSGTFRRPGGR